MKKNVVFTGIVLWSIVCLAIIAFIVVGLVSPSRLGTISCSFGGNFFRDLDNGLAARSTNLIKEETLPLQDVSRFWASTGYEDIRVTLVQGDSVTVRQYGDSQHDKPFTVTRNGGQLGVRTQTRDTFSFFSIRFQSSYLEISLPASYAKDIKLDTSSGNISVGGKARWASVELSSTSGEIELPEGFDAAATHIVSTSGDLTIGPGTVSDLNMRTTSGEIHSDSLLAERGITVSSTSGSLKLGELQAGSDVLLSSTSGEVMAHALICRQYDIKTTSGDISVNMTTGQGRLHSTSGAITARGISPTGDISINTISGDVRLDILSGQSFSFRLNSVSGDIRSNQPLTYADRGRNSASGSVGNNPAGTISVDTMAGEIRLELEDVD